MEAWRERREMDGSELMVRPDEGWIRLKGTVVPEEGTDRERGKERNGKEGDGKEELWPGERKPSCVPAGTLSHNRRVGEKSSGTATGSPRAG